MARLLNSSEGHDRIAECRTLLRDFRTPGRLRYNSLATEVLATATSTSERRLWLETVVYDALGSLEPRERAIVQRCDIEQERYAAVARDLGISERHLYREHRRILESLVDSLSRASRQTCHINPEEPISLDDHIRTCRVLEENGSASAAVGMLERLIGTTPREADKCRLLLRLAELHARSGRFAAARGLLETVHDRLESVTRNDDGLAAEYHLSRACVFYDCGQGETTVDRHAADAARLLRKVGTFRYDEHATGALVLAVILGGLSKAKSGQLDGLAASMLEVTEVLPIVRRPDEVLLTWVFDFTAHYELFCNANIGAACQGFLRSANVARAAGFTLSSIISLTNLANAQRLGKDKAAAVETLSGLPALARELANKNVLLAVLIEQANLHMDLGDHEAAQTVLIEASTLRVENEALRAAMLRSCAKLNIETSQYEAALDQARAAESCFAAQGKLLMVGTPLRMQAEALFGLGDRRAALRAASDAIEIYSATGSDQNLIALKRQEAYRTLNRIKGNRKLPPSRAER